MRQDHKDYLGKGDTQVALDYRVLWDSQEQSELRDTLALVGLLGQQVRLDHFHFRQA